VTYPLTFRSSATLFTLVLCLATSLLLWAAGAAAQSVDYGALQDLFGQPVTTSVVGTPQRVRDVPADMEIITADDIRRSGAIDIPGILSHVTGLDVERWTNLGADVSVRGYDGPDTPRLLVLINGRQVYLDIYGLTDWAALPVELIEIRQIEIVKGPNSALFGFNAAAGVINIITYNPVFDTMNTAKVSFGSQGYRDGSAVGTVRFGNTLALRLSAGGTLSDDFDTIRAIAASQNIPDRITRSHLGADAHWQINATSEAELEATYGADGRLAETSVWLPAFQETQNHSLSGRYTADTIAGIVTANAYTNWSHISELYGAAQVAYADVLTVATLQDVLKPTANQTIRLSTEYRNSSADTAPVTGAKIYYNIGALAAMWNWDALPALSLTASARLDALWLGRSGPPLAGSDLTNAFWNRQITTPSYNLGAVWRPDEADGVRLTVSRGLQLPSLIALGAVQSKVGVFDFSGNPATAPAVVENYEMDWDRELAGWKAHARVALFYQTTRDIATDNAATIRETANGNLLAWSGNVANSREIGAEFTFKGALAHAWRWGLSYSPRTVSEHFFPGNSEQTAGFDFARTTPRHVVNASLGWSGGPWELDSFFRFQSSSAGLARSDTGVFTLVPLGPVESCDVHAGYRVNDHITLSLAGQNLFLSSARQTVLGKIQQRIVGALSVGF
jgi:outer membrane receptor for ferrienterochelin and colicins